MSAFKIDPEATYFIDTNIWLYAFIQGQDADKNKVARTVIKVRNDHPQDYTISEAQTAYDADYTPEKKH